MCKEYCPVCKHLTYKEERGEYYPDGMQITPDIGYCPHCDFRYSQHTNNSMERQVERHIKWLKKISNIYKKLEEVKNEIQVGK